MNPHRIAGERPLASQGTVVFADMNKTGPLTPAAIAASIVQAAEQSLSSGQFDIAEHALSREDMHRALFDFPSGQERISLDRTVVILDAGAMLAYAPYRSNILLSHDPFDDADQLGEMLGLDANSIRIRLHDAMLSASSIVTLSKSAFSALSPLISKPIDHRALPPTPLRVDGEAVLVVCQQSALPSEDVLNILAKSFPHHEFVQYDPSTVFEQRWKLMLQVGIAELGLPGARLTDAWAGGLPVVQVVNPAWLRTERRRRQGQLVDVVVEHGKTGLLCTTAGELKTLLGDLFQDILPARVVARGARLQSEPAGEWDALLKVLFQ